MSEQERQPDQNGDAQQPHAETADGRRMCFVIMPFGGYFDGYYDKLYVPAIRSAGLVARRADHRSLSSPILDDIWEYTKKADVILADLSGNDPNVFYELGLAHAIQKPAVLIAETLDDVPFDVRGVRIIVYDKNKPAWGSILEKNIACAITETLEAPLKSIVPTFLDTTTVARQEVSPHEKRILQLEAQVGALNTTMADMSTVHLDRTGELVRKPLPRFTRQPIDEVLGEYAPLSSEVERAIDELGEEHARKNP